MDWFRLYHDVLNDAKVQRLPIGRRWNWIELLCVASQNKDRGSLPAMDDIAYHLRCSRPSAERIVKDLIDAGLIDQDKATKALVMHNWEERQRKSDTSAGRVAALRRRRKTDTCNGDVTLQKRPRVRAGAGSETETETEREENPPLPPPIVLGLGPEFDAVGEFAIQLMGDVSWGRWVTQQGMCGHPAGTIRRALEEASGAGKLSQAYVAAKLRGWAQDGGPPKRKGENNGKTSVQQRSDETLGKIPRPDLPRTPQFAGVNRYYDDMEAGRTPNPKDLAI